MAFDIIFTGHIPDDGGDEDVDDEKSRKASPFSAYDENDDTGSSKERRSGRAASLPGTPRRSCEPLREYVSESESGKSGGGRRRRWNLEKNLDRAWEMRRSRAGLIDGLLGGDGGECLVMVMPRGSSGKRICMDMDEVKACCDLGLEIPRDFTVEIPGGLSGNSSSCDSPISGPGDDAKEIKAKLKMWAHAVAFVSSAARASR